jgi:hypothetical protein
MSKATTFFIVSASVYAPRAPLRRLFAFKAGSGDEKGEVAPHFEGETAFRNSVRGVHLSPGHSRSYKHLHTHRHMNRELEAFLGSRAWISALPTSPDMACLNSYTADALSSPRNTGLVKISIHCIEVSVNTTCLNLQVLSKNLLFFSHNTNILQSSNNNTCTHARAI